jgi:hypothetical protein
MIMKKQISTVVCGFTCAGLVLTALVAADDGTEPKWLNDYVGAARCQACHQEIYNAWSRSPHALAYDGVFGKFPGRLQNRVKSEPHCLSCHITAILENGELLTGVQCEACHGPGSGHIALNGDGGNQRSEDPPDRGRMARDAALSLPTAESCNSSHCHVKENNPCYVQFDFAAWRDKMHAIE